MTVQGQETDIFDDLAAECDQLDLLLSGLSPDAWARESAAAGWSVSDVVLHLAQTEELAIASIAGDTGAFAREDGVSVDEAVDRLVAAERGVPPAEVLERWRRARRAALDGLRACPPKQRLSWAAMPLSPRTFATARLAEHWAHALDIATPLGLDYPATDRLRHIAWLGHRTLPYAFALAGEEAGPVRCELVGPSGDVWRFGDPDAPSVISGSAEEFCRIGAQRLAAQDSTLKTEGPDAARALRVLRNYAS
ncbi:maleylpyruvate isomerase family mycothiol-dependent enzyme [Thermopolyspora sp. NPDC052614]|uniref:maleylpyruvate isomerase family mycothiol-dependent enzyme n=1 Tax=Thermopolyspora sp. NPDC052614 TaxID=3155682 RepID=UPI003417ED96